MAAAYCHQHAQEPTSYRPPAVDAGGRCERKRKRRKAFGRVCRATTSNPSRGSPSARFGRPPRIVRLLTLIYLGRTEARRTGGWDRGCLARQTRRTAAFAWPAVALLAGCLYRRPWYLVCAASNQPTLQSLRAYARRLPSHFQNDPHTPAAVGERLFFFYVRVYASGLGP